MLVVHRPFEIEAVQITAENVAEFFCGESSIGMWRVQGEIFLMSDAEFLRRYRPAEEK